VYPRRCDASCAEEVVEMAGKKLYRSRTEKMLGGVCGGLAEYLDFDVTLIRVLWVLATLLGGSGGLAYLILWIIVPREPAV
jgi:phage shock protein PspC (stress-responsive transcriptional regulator)